MPAKPVKPKRDPLKEQLDALRDVRGQPGTPQAAEVLRAALSHKSNFAVAAAAEQLTELEPRDLLALLPPAFQRFLQDPVKTDPGCKAKTAIAEALHRLECDEPELFLAGLHHLQPEPAWGGSVDTAVELRGTCALAIARLGHPDALDELAALLADKERGARAAAARAVGCAGHPAGVPLLRFKALIGDEDQQVITECLTALLLLEPGPSLAFVRGFLTSATSEAAALALGQSRLDEAFPLLRAFAEDALPGGLGSAQRKLAYLALAMLRVPAATDYLLSVVSEGRDGQAGKAIEALALHRYDAALVARVEQAVTARDSEALREAFAKAFHPQ